jgi:hypothetical protein
VTWLPAAALLIAILAVICGVGFGVIGVDSRDGRDWQELLPREW